MRAKILLLTLAALLPACAAFASDPQWTVPTAAELAMTSLPEAAGVSAVFLYREEIALADEHATTLYVRIKVLNESGKDYANVELPTGGASEVKFDAIAGRTIHPDGSIVPFTGKPYEKLITKSQGYTYKVKIFSLPAVEVGSIIEYRYRRTTQYENAPDWYVQRELYVRKAHYVWKPLAGQSIAWTPILPSGVKVEQSTKGGDMLQLNVENIAPAPRDEMMPPLDSVSYRVLFYYTLYRSAEEFWTRNGMLWSEAMDKFLGPGKGVRAAVAGMTSATDTDEQKLRKIYADVMTMENTDFTRQLTVREAKSKGLNNDPSSTDDILLHRRGTANQLAVLFASMARAAGMKAYVMRVADRSERLFLAAYLNFDQLDDYIVIVRLNGVETYFDPGQRYCPYARLAWYHAFTEGLRQTNSGTLIEATPAQDYKENRTTRTADVTLDAQGGATGKIAVTYAGDPARHWRQIALKGDATGLKADLKAELVDVLPAGVDIEVVKLGDLTDSDKPLSIEYEFHGSIGSSTGKRLLVPANLFQARMKPRFPSEKREVQVDMHYGSLVQDAVRYKIPAGMNVESAMVAERDDNKGQAAFDSWSKQAGGTITVFRNAAIARAIFTVAEYPALRDIYKKIEARDQEAVIFTRDAVSTVKPAGAN